MRHKPRGPVLSSPLRRALLQAGLGLTVAGLAGCYRTDGGYGHAAIRGTWRNWSGSQQSRPRRFHRPASEAALIEDLHNHRLPVRVAGASHSFSALVHTEDVLLSLDALSGIVRHDAAALQATVWAGTRLRDMGAPLDALGQGLVNQGDVDPQAIAGAIATSTHGTGIGLGSFSSLVTGLRLVTAAGEIVECDSQRHPELLQAAATSLGALGIVTQVTLQNRPAYRLHERVFSAPLREVLESAPRWRDENRHFEFFAFFESDMALVKILNETEEPATGEPLPLPADAVLWAACELAHAVPALDGAVQRLLTRLAPEEERVGPSWRIFPTARTVRFNEMEYEVPAEQGLACLEELRDTVRRAGVNTLFPIEFRYVAADECWLSPFYRRASASISVHQYWQVDYRPLFDVAEPVLRRYGGRPHWGKLHRMEAADLALLYPRWEAFQKLRRELDPKGRFLNEHLRGLFGEPA